VEKNLKIFLKRLETVPNWREMEPISLAQEMKISTRTLYGRLRRAAVLDQWKYSGSSFPRKHSDTVARFISDIQAVPRWENLTAYQLGKLLSIVPSGIYHRLRAANLMEKWQASRAARREAQKETRLGKQPY
jgi:hypothetical protein